MNFFKLDSLQYKIRKLPQCVWRSRSPRLRRNRLSLWSERVTITICKCFWFALSSQIEIRLKVSKNAFGCKLKTTMSLLAVSLLQFVFKQDVGGLFALWLLLFFSSSKPEWSKRIEHDVCTELNTLMMQGGGDLRRIMFVNRNGPNDWFQAGLRTNLLFWSKG